MGPDQPRKQRRPKRSLAGPRAAGEGLYRQLVETIEERHLIYAHSVEGVFTDVSPGITRLLGYTPEEFSTHYTRYLTDHPANREAMRHTDLAIQGQRQPPYEVEIFHKDGSRRWLEVVETPVLDEGGRVVSVHGLARDISDLKRAEAALRASEKRYRSLFDAATDAILVADAATGRLLDANPMAEALLGRDLAEIRGLHQSQLHPPEQLEAALRTFEQAGARADLVEIDVLDRAGRRIPVEIAPSVLEEEGGRRLILGTFRDASRRRAMEQALRESERRFRAVLENVRLLAVVLGVEGGITYVNDHLVQTSGWPRAELLGRDWFELFSPSPGEARAAWRAGLAGGEPPRGFESELVLRGGERRLVAWDAVALRDARGALTGCAWLGSDITERRRAETLQSALYRVTEQAAATRDLPELCAAAHAIVGELMDARNFFVALHDEASDQLDYIYFVDECEPQPPPEPAGRSLTAFVLRTGQPQLVPPARFHELVQGGEVELVGAPSLDWLGVPLKGGGRVFGALVVQSYREGTRFDQRQLEVLTFVSQHIGTALERKMAEEAIRHHAYHDPLTRLPNRLLFRDRLAQALALAERREELLAGMFLDLDRFKNINDTLGHAAGDRLLQEVGRRLTRRLRDGDTVARLGGDEFMLVLPGLQHAEDAARLGREILEVLQPAVELDGHELRVTGSLGVALFPHDGRDVETLVKHADIALYRAKECGRANCQLYSPGMNVRSLELLTLESRLRAAVERGEFVLHYQPQVELGSGRIAGVEALLRWRGPGGQLVPPDQFIPLCEDTGLIVPVGAWALREACRQRRLWNDSGVPPFPVAVNLSPRQLSQPGLVALVRQALAEARLEPSELELELTESGIMQGPASAADLLRDLRSAGVSLSIDDFGTGYSSLSALRSFPIQGLKIDRSFVRDCTVDADDAALVRAIISMAQSLKLRVVAEGVETGDQRDFLRRHGCQLAQGYLFGRPLEAGELERSLSVGGPRRE